MKIALDAMGGDHAPEEIVRGALEFLEEPEHRDVEVILVGSEKDVAPLASASRHWGTRLQLVHAPERIGMDLAPTEAVRRFKEASIVVAAGLVGWSGRCLGDAGIRVSPWSQRCAPSAAFGE